jgi:CRISPR-associated protein Cas5t
MLFIHFKAPFGAFRPFKNIELATTAPFLTYSAAYGLLLGLAGVDRLRKKEFCGARLALGCQELPRVGRTFQQLIRDKREIATNGGQLTLRPFWREVLSGLEGYIGLDFPHLEKLVESGINNPASLDYWGLPFLGDNNFFLEKVDTCSHPPLCRWFYPFDGNQLSRGERLHYLSIWTDYEANVNSKGMLFALSQPQTTPAPKAWVVVEEANQGTTH